MTDAEKVEIRTPWEGCWKDPAHHGCAVKEVERLRAEKDAVKISAWNKSAEQLREMARLRSERDALERANAELNVEISRLYACRDELQEVTEAMNAPAVNNTVTLKDAERFAALVAAHEREECAKVCLDEAPTLDGQLCAAAIRARGET